HMRPPPYRSALQNEQPNKDTVRARLWEVFLHSPSSLRLSTTKPETANPLALRVHRHVVIPGKSSITCILMTTRSQVLGWYSSTIPGILDAACPVTRSVPVAAPPDPPPRAAAAPLDLPLLMAAALPLGPPDLQPPMAAALPPDLPPLIVAAAPLDPPVAAPVVGETTPQVPVPRTRPVPLVAPQSSPVAPTAPLFLSSLLPGLLLVPVVCCLSQCLFLCPFQFLCLFLFLSLVWSVVCS
ncbi:hypothetical protein P4O66_008030, partial [Electrophorus voltai]